MNSNDTARRLGVAFQTLAEMHCKGLAPPATRDEKNGRLDYDPVGVDAYVAARAEGKSRAEAAKLAELALSPLAAGPTLIQFWNDRPRELAQTERGHWFLLDDCGGIELTDAELIATLRRDCPVIKNERDQAAHYGNALSFSTPAEGK